MHFTKIASKQYGLIYSQILPVCISYQGFRHSAETLWGVFQADNLCGRVCGAGNLAEAVAAAGPGAPPPHPLPALCPQEWQQGQRRQGCSGRGRCWRHGCDSGSRQGGGCARPYQHRQLQSCQVRCRQVIAGCLCFTSSLSSKANVNMSHAD